MSKPNVLNISKWSHLNKTDSPQNIPDHALSELINAEVTVNNTIKGRKGYTHVQNITGTNATKGLHKVTWGGGAGTKTYVWINHSLNILDEDDGTLTKLANLVGGGQVYSATYNDYLVYLNPDERPKLVHKDTDNILSMEPPLVQVKETLLSTVDDSEGILDESSYIYTVTIGYGGDYVGGDSYYAKDPTASPEWAPYNNVIAYPYTMFTYTGSGKAIESSDDVQVDINSNNWNLFSLTLWRAKADIYLNRHAYYILSSQNIWEAIDVITFSKTGNGTIDGMETSLTDTITGITVDSSGAPDKYVLNLSFTDNGTKDVGAAFGYPAGSIPYDISEISKPKARTMAVMGNRIFLGNIRNEPYGQKMVRYTYRGFRPFSSGLGEEMVMDIPDYTYPDPQAIFPTQNCYFYCEKFNIEDEIVALYALRDRLYTFTERSVFAWKEGMPEPEKLSSTTGCIAPQSIADFEGNIIWLAREGFYLLSGNKIENISRKVIQPYIDGLNLDTVYSADAIIHDRKYFITLPIDTAGYNNKVLVYDFTTGSWHLREYTHPYQGDTSLAYIDTFHEWDGKLFAAMKDVAATCSLARMEAGWQDYGEDITMTVKMKYFDMGTPQFAKVFRALFIDVQNALRQIDLSIYIDDLNSAAQTISHSLSDGFVLGSATDGILGTTSITSSSDAMTVFSLERGNYGSRVQVGLETVNGGGGTEIRALGIDWFTKRNLKMRYGG